jgi:hypothetical protein
VRPDQLQAYYPSKQISRVHCKSGRLESLYIGKRGEDNFVRIYDKKLHSQEMNAQFGLKLPVPLTETTRIEICMMPKCGFESLISVANPFEKLILETQFPSFEKEQLWRTFRVAAQFIGLPSALLMLDPTTRAKYIARFKATPSTWWKPQEIWKQWPSVVEGVRKTLSFS